MTDRCESRCYHETEWSLRSKRLSRAARLHDWKTRCVKQFGHTGPHLGPDESVWQDSEAEDRCIPKK